VGENKADKLLSGVLEGELEKSASVGVGKIREGVSPSVGDGKDTVSVAPPVGVGKTNVGMKPPVGVGDITLEVGVGVGEDTH